jgi:hypothetical protein
MQTAERVTASQEDTFPRPMVLRSVRTLLAAGEVHLVGIIGGTNHRQRELLAWFDLHSESLVITNVVRVEAVPRGPISSFLISVIRDRGAGGPGKTKLTRTRSPSRHGSNNDANVGTLDVQNLPLRGEGLI